MSIYYLKLSKDHNSGLCNQVYSLAGCIEYCVSKGIKLLIIDKFLKEIQTNDMCLASDIIDMPKLNLFLKEYGIQVFDKLENDKTESNISPILHMGKSYNIRMFTYILNNIPFLEKYKQIARNQVGSLDRFNIIHLRLENDALDIFSSDMCIHRDVYKKINESRYIECIEKYIDKSIMTIVLTGDNNNKVIKFLQDNNYRFMTTTKEFDKRELNALVDLHIGVMCTDVLIGCYDSSFSYTILNRVLMKRNPSFFSCMIEMNKFNDFYRLYHYDTYTTYLNDANIEFLIFRDSKGVIYKNEKLNK